MGNQSTKYTSQGYRQIIPDEAHKAEAGLPNIYTPSKRYIDMVCGNKSVTPVQREKEIFNFLMCSPEDSIIKKMHRYITHFLLGGICGIIISSINDIGRNVQYFPFRKVEQYVGERRRLSLYPAKYLIRR